jgi:hypothetical protein
MDEPDSENFAAEVGPAPPTWRPAPACFAQTCVKEMNLQTLLADAEFTKNYLENILDIDTAQQPPQ